MTVISEILAATAHVKFLGRSTDAITVVQPLDPKLSSNESLFWCSEENQKILSEFTAGTFICSVRTPENFLVAGCNYIFVENPRRAFQQVLNKFFVATEESVGIAATAKIHATVKIGKAVSIGEYCVIEKNCVIDDRTTIASHTIIYANTLIGHDVVIGSHNTIGAAGFGYEKNEAGDLELIPHVGNVIIHDCVHIGDNNTIDRAVLGSTILRSRVLVDNHVYVAHNTDLGEGVCLMAHVSIMGSVTLGRRVQVAPAASVLNTLKIPEDVFIGMGAVVINAPQKGDVVVGNPAKKIRNTL